MALQIICNAPEEPYDGHNADTGKAILLSRSFDWKAKLPEMGSAARLFLWVHWRQAEAGARLSLTDQEIAEASECGQEGPFKRGKQSLVGPGILRSLKQKDKEHSGRPIMRV